MLKPTNVLIGTYFGGFYNAKKSINNFNTALGENITLNIIEDDFKIKLTIKNKNKILLSRETIKDKPIDDKIYEITLMEIINNGFYNILNYEKN